MKLFNPKKHSLLPVIYYAIKEIKGSAEEGQLQKIINAWNNNAVNEVVNINASYTSNLFNHFANVSDKP